MRRGLQSKDPQAARVTSRQATAFRLGRQMLDRRVPHSKMVPALSQMGGAQAQILSAAQISVWARVDGLNVADIDSALWRDRSVARAWCMRRTLHLVPADELAVFARGSSKRAEREVRWALNQGVSRPGLEKALGDLLGAMDRPLTYRELALRMRDELGYKLIYRAGGGWGSRRDVPWTKVEHLALPVGYLLHISGARGVTCSGPTAGGESTYVRADRWVKDWKDISVERAEDRLLAKYLGAHGPATVADFATWTGMTVTDSEGIWERNGAEIARVEVEGQTAGVLSSDLGDLEEADVESPAVSLLPFYDSYVLGHRSHRHVVGEEDHLKVYRPQGWVSPILLIDGRAQGVWAHTVENGVLSVKVKAFSRLSSVSTSHIREEADDLGRFFGCEEVRTAVG